MSAPVLRKMTLATACSGNSMAVCVVRWMFCRIAIADAAAEVAA